MSCHDGVEYVFSTLGLVNLSVDIFINIDSLQVLNMSPTTSFTVLIFLVQYMLAHMSYLLA